MPHPPSNKMKIHTDCATVDPHTLEKTISEGTALSEFLARINISTIVSHLCKPVILLLLLPIISYYYFLLSIIYY